MICFLTDGKKHKDSRPKIWTAIFVCGERYRGRLYGFMYGEDAMGNSNLFLYEEARNFDWGVSSNIGIETNHWYAKLQYDLSLGKEGKNDVIGANYHTLTLSVGYKFGL